MKKTFFRNLFTFEIYVSEGKSERLMVNFFSRKIFRGNLNNAISFNEIVSSRFLQKIHVKR